MSKKSDKRKAKIKKLKAKVQHLRVRLEKAERAKARWKAEAKQWESATSRSARKSDREIARLREELAASRVPSEMPEGVVTDGLVAGTPDRPDISWTWKRLRVAARRAGVRGYSRMSKAALVDALAPPPAVAD